MPSKLTKRVVDDLQPARKPYELRDTELRNFLVRVEPSGSKTFWYTYRLAGGRKGRYQRYRIGSHPALSIDAARTLARSIAGDVARGIDPQARRRAERAEADRKRYSTLRAFLGDRYEPWARVHLKSWKFQLARLRSDFADHLDRPLQTFSPSLVEALRQTWKKDGMKPRTINRDMQRLQSVLSKANEWGILDCHPLAGLRPLKTDKAGRVRFLSNDEEAALRKALGARERQLREARIRFNAWRVARGKAPLPNRDGDYLDHLRPLVLLAMNTGLRRGELLGLRWSAIDFQAKILTVVAETAKSGHTRRVPLNAEAFEVLSLWHKRRGKPGADAFVFSGPRGERMSRVDTAWRSLMKAAGIKNFRLHDCRHHFASRLVQAGVDLYTVKELLGHSDIEMTERYAHLAPHGLRAAVERIVATN